MSIGRRLLGLSAIAFAVALSGCGGDDDGDDESAASDPAQERVAQLIDAAESDGSIAYVDNPPPPGRGKRPKTPACPKGFEPLGADEEKGCRSEEPQAPAGEAKKKYSGNAAALADAAFDLAVDYAEGVINSNFGGDPITYRYLIYPQDCSATSGDTGRCPIYLWKQSYATGYGYGGIDRGVFREAFFATHVGEGYYSTRIIPIDFIDPYSWECSDTPRAGVPACS